MAGKAGQIIKTPSWYGFPIVPTVVKTAPVE